MPRRPLTADERKCWRLRLEQAMPPGDMVELVEELRGILRGHMLVQAGLAFVREAWTAGRFAQVRGADTVRLWPGDRPDCELVFQGRQELFEIVEADQPGRQRSAEYRELIRRAERGEPDMVEDDPVENWITRAASGPQMLQEAATKKARKGYDPSVGLLIYLNLGEYDIRRQEIEASMQRCTASAKDAFDDVWVLWKGIPYPVWRRGEAVPMDAWPKRRDDEEDRLASDAAIWKSIVSK